MATTNSTKSLCDLVIKNFMHIYTATITHLKIGDKSDGITVAMATMTY